MYKKRRVFKLKQTTQHLKELESKCADLLSKEKVFRIYSVTFSLIVIWLLVRLFKNHLIVLFCLMFEVNMTVNVIIFKRFIFYLLSCVLRFLLQTFLSIVLYIFNWHVSKKFYSILLLSFDNEVLLKFGVFNLQFYIFATFSLSTKY